MRFKQFLFLQRAAPLAAGPEAFDLVMTAAAFDQELTLILLDDAVFWLNCGMPPLLLETLDNFFVETESLAARGMDQSPLPAKARLVGRETIATLIQAADLVIGA